MSFALTGSLLGLSLMAAAAFAMLVLPRKSALWRWLPRERIAGTALMVLCLAWSAYLVAPLLEGGLSVYRKLLPCLVVLIAAGGYFLLEYLFTRALGGFLLLICSHMLHEAFACQAPWRWLFAIICYALGIIGMVMIANPWRFRELLQILTEKEKPRRAVAAGLLVCGLICLSIALGSLAAPG